MPTGAAAARPLVGLLYNPAIPHVIEYAAALVEYVEVIPDRLWYDFGERAGHNRFQRVHGGIDTLKRCAEGRVVGGHGIGLSLPSAMPIDAPQLEAVAEVARELDFRWYSEHMSMFLVPHGSVPNAQAGLGLPVVYDKESLAILGAKLGELRAALGCPLLLENGAIFTPIPDLPLSEPEFFRRLHAEHDCGMLLDLHNLHVTWRSGGPEPRAYLEALDPAMVREIHVAGGDEMAGFYTDSHSRLTPPEVRALLAWFAPRCPNLRAIVFEFHESYFEDLGLQGLARELEGLHAVAETRELIHAG